MAKKQKRNVEKPEVNEEQMNSAVNKLKNVEEEYGKKSARIAGVYANLTDLSDRHHSKALRSNTGEIRSLLAEVEKINAELSKEPKQESKQKSKQKSEQIEH